MDPHRKHVACLEVYDEIGRTERLICEDEGNELGISVLLREFVSKEIIIRNTVQMRESVMNQNIRRNHFRDFHSRLSICVDLNRILQLLPIELIPQFILQNPKKRNVLRVRRH